MPATLSTTQLVNIRELREKLPSFLRALEKGKQHFVIMRHGKPIAHLTGIAPSDDSLEGLLKTLQKSERQIARGLWHSQKDAEKMFS